MGAQPLIVCDLDGFPTAARSVAVPYQVSGPACPVKVPPGSLIASDIEEVPAVSDVLIRDVPDDVLAAVESHAARLGLSRNEYLRRQLAQDAMRSTTETTMDDLRWFADTFSDLTDPEVMRQAWT
jgi:hypothetical protein